MIKLRRKLFVWRLVFLANFIIKLNFASSGVFDFIVFGSDIKLQILIFDLIDVLLLEWTLWKVQALLILGGCVLFDFCYTLEIIFFDLLGFFHHPCTRQIHLLFNYITQFIIRQRLIHFQLFIFLRWEPRGIFTDILIAHLVVLK